MRKAITLQYVGTSNASLLYGPETPYSTQRTNVKTAVKNIVNNSGSGIETYWEIWIDAGLVKNYHARYGGGTVASPTWSDKNPTAPNQLG